MIHRQFQRVFQLTSKTITRTIQPTISNFIRITPSIKFSFAQVKERMEFKTETKRLLDIVAKSLYTDSQVFIRELLSNSSDALEKQRFKSQSSGQLLINVEIFPTKNQLVIQDNGIGMNRESLISHLGTIAKSGSKQFVESLKEGDAKENIIGQFGVGFYSSFIVSDLVQVISRQQGGPAYKWSSDGSGTFQIQQTEEDSFTRGTKIILHIKQQHNKFIQKTTIQQIVQKYSNFINFPISINGEAVNLVKPLWTKAKSEVTEQEYSKFFQYLTNGSQKYQYKLHFNSDVPLNLKTILYIPKTHSQKFGFSQQRGQVSLYSKKVLIKKDCKQILLPNFFRFVKGVVDCQDIPLNISRQTFQDTALIHKLKTFLTKRIIKLLKDEAEKNPAQYNIWYQNFGIFLKEGSIDSDFKKDVADLNRYQLNTEDGFFSLKDYVAKKKNTQDVIFYVVSPNREAAQDSPFAYPLTKEGIPVLVASTHIQEIIFNEIGTYEGLKFANVETSSEDVERCLKGVKQQDKKQDVKHQHNIPEDDITSFSLWIKNQLQPHVQKVVVSNKALYGPALVISPISSSMRQMAFMKAMMEEQSKSGKGRTQMLKNITFEYDKNNDLIVKLNEFRKNNPDDASNIIRQIFDNACVQSGLENDTKSMIKRINKLMLKIIEKQTPKQQSS